ncbi:putative diguanylate cyclase DgcT [Anaerolineae bacterium]|nr:putative diguanylate cyclase DgcT [Anaerolineae bacterium]
MSSLDIRTLAFVLAAIITIQSLGLFVVWQRRKTTSGFGLWTAACTIFAVSLFLLGLRNLIPDFFSVVIANALQFVAGILLFMGIRRFFNSPYHDYLNYLLAATAFLLLIYFLYIRDEITVRILIVSVAWLLGCLRCAIILIVDTPKELRASARFTAVVFGTLGLVHLFRGAVVLVNPAESEMFAPTPTQAFFFVALIGLTLCMTFGLYMMMSKRFELELANIVHQANTDDLTGVWNRRYLFELSQQEFKRARRYDRPLSVLAIDIDHFKKVNDAHGHIVGDLLLKELASTVQSVLRESDVFARTGGEEFMVLLPESDATDSATVAERVRRAISRVTINARSVPVGVTISIGVASLSIEDQDIQAVYQRADAGLYEAKHKGRNCIILKQG